MPVVYLYIVELRSKTSAIVIGYNKGNFTFTLLYFISRLIICVTLESMARPKL